MSNSLNPDQDRHSVGPDLSPNCLQRLSAEDKVKASNVIILYIGFIAKNLTMLPVNNKGSDQMCSHLCSLISAFVVPSQLIL